VNGTREQLLPRLADRRGHFMPVSLLDSQLADLEPPGPDEQAVVVDAIASPADQAAAILLRIGGADSQSAPRSPRRC
jgi:gluconokinase